MAEQRTILKHIDPKKETWKTPSSVIKKKLRDRVSVRNFKIRYDAGPIGKFRLGIIGGGNIGVQYKKKF
jgi:hypothetical protein